MERLKPLEHRIKAGVFAASRSFLKRGEDDFHVIDGNAIKKVLFLRPEKIGDMVISFPVFDGLRSQFPHLEFGILASPRSYGLIKDDPRFQRVFLYTKKIWRDLKDLLAIRREQYDCVVDMICDDSVTALFLSQLTAPGKPRVGVGKVKYRQYYDFNYDHRMGNTGHIIENTLKLLEAFGIDSESVSGYARPYLSKASDARAAAFIEQQGDCTLVGYNVSAGSPTRIWQQEKSVDLVRRILARDERTRVVIIVTPNDRERGETIGRAAGDRAVLVPEGLSLMEVSALIKRLDLLITPDTSLVHIARAFGVPVVGLYCSFMKNYLLWRPYDQEIGSVVAQSEGDIFDITVDHVFDTFVETIQRYGAVRR